MPQSLFVDQANQQGVPSLQAKDQFRASSQSFSAPSPVPMLFP